MQAIKSIALLALVLGVAGAPSTIESRQEVATANAALRCIAEGLIAGPASNQEAFLTRICGTTYGCTGGLDGFTVSGAVILGTCIDCPVNAPGAALGGCLLAFA